MPEDTKFEETIEQIDKLLEESSKLIRQLIDSRDSQILPKYEYVSVEELNEGERKSI